ncbi:MAG: hypothetical protein ABIQ44_16250 [Chloroflexia bacterium]
MNKTSQRAAQKHRANAKRFALRRKSETGQQAAVKPKGPAGTAPARTRTPKVAADTSDTASA